MKYFIFIIHDRHFIDLYVSKGKIYTRTEGSNRLTRRIRRNVEPRNVHVIRFYLYQHTCSFHTIHTHSRQFSATSISFVSILDKTVSKNNPQNHQRIVLSPFINLSNLFYSFLCSMPTIEPSFAGLSLWRLCFAGRNFIPKPFKVHAYIYIQFTFYPIATFSNILPFFNKM